MAVDCLEQMIEDRDLFAPLLSSSKPIRSSQRWPVLAKMMNLPVEAI
jgi:hypothetical protein